MYCDIPRTSVIGQSFFMWPAKKKPAIAIGMLLGDGVRTEFALRNVAAYG